MFSYNNHLFTLSMKFTVENTENSQDVSNKIFILNQ